MREPHDRVKGEIDVDGKLRSWTVDRNLASQGPVRATPPGSSFMLAPEGTWT
jgi:hypothetical protein